jgi:aryl-alcohol dehydrogenase-like predicted oxidoreductase
VRYRRFGRTGWQVSEIGYGMWGMGGWSGSDDEESRAALALAVELGCTFFDTAWAYGSGKSERLLAELRRANPERTIYACTKVPPKSFRWPSQRGDALDDLYPADHVREYVEKSLENLGTDRIDLLLFHVWEDEWADDPRWQREVERLKREGLAEAVGISVNWWEPWNVLRALRTGLVDAIQVVYNVFEQAPEDELLPLCRELDVGVIARVPFDEGSLTGAVGRGSSWPPDDPRSRFFAGENLERSVERVEALKADLPSGSDLPEVALRFILSNPDVATIIPGMRRPAHVRANLAASDRGPLPPDLLATVRAHRWDRSLAAWLGGR